MMYFCPLSLFYFYSSKERITRLVANVDIADHKETPKPFPSHCLVTENKKAKQNAKIHWRTLKTQKMKIIVFWTQNIFSLLFQVKSAWNDTLPLSIHNTGVFIDNGHHQLLIRDLLFLHVASPRINEAKHFIISHMPCRYTCIKNTVALVLQLYYSCHFCLNMNDLAQYIYIDDIRSGWLPTLPDQ